MEIDQADVLGISPNIQFSFQSGHTTPVASHPHPYIAYIKNDELIIAYLSDRGFFHEAKLQLEHWITRIIADMGYKLIIGALIDRELVNEMDDMMRRLADKAGLRIKWQSQWTG